MVELQDEEDIQNLPGRIGDGVTTFNADDSLHSHQIHKTIRITLRQASRPVFVSLVMLAQEGLFSGTRSRGNVERPLQIMYLVKIQMKILETIQRAFLTAKTITPHIAYGTHLVADDHENDGESDGGVQSLWRLCVAASQLPQDCDPDHHFWTNISSP